MPAVTRRQLLGAVAAPLVAQTRARRPNVILIISDDQGYGDLSLHGNPHLKTPNLDRIGREGVQFTQFQVCPVCSPTRSSLMTGRYNYRTGVVDTYLGRSMMHPDEVTLPEILGRAGYRTGIFGKWHLGDNYPLRSIDQGFQESVVCTGGGLTQPSDPPGNTYFDPLLKHNGQWRKYKGYCTDIFFEAAARFIEENRARPFFTYLATNAPHDPLQIDEAYVTRFRAMGLDDATAKTYGMVKNIDDNAGRLLDQVTKLGLERDTLVMFLTDNGPQRQRYNAGMRGRKGTVYQGGIRVPCFARWPETLAPGRAVPNIAAHIDLLPTLLEACGVERGEGPPLDGRSLMPLLRGDGAGWPERTLYTQWHRGDEPQLYRACAARTQRYKLLDGKELYDLLEDPGEQRDIGAAHPAIVARMREGYERWFQDVSTSRGYAPPRIQLGTPHENPVTLTRQDWRGPRASWDGDGLGHWEVEVAAAGAYEVTLRRPGGDAGIAHFQLSGAAHRQPVPKGAGEVRFNGLKLKPGPGKLEAFVQTGETTRGVHYVDVRKS